MILRIQRAGRMRNHHLCAMLAVALVSAPGGAAHAAGKPRRPVALRIGISDGRTRVRAGDRLTYVTEVSNTGNTRTPDLLLTQTLTPGLELVLVEPSREVLRRAGDVDQGTAHGREGTFQRDRGRRATGRTPAATRRRGMRLHQDRQTADRVRQPSGSPADGCSRRAFETAVHATDLGSSRGRRGGPGRSHVACVATTADDDRLAPAPSAPTTPRSPREEGTGLRAELPLTTTDSDVSAGIVVPRAVRTAGYFQAALPPPATISEVGRDSSAQEVEDCGPSR